MMVGVSSLATTKRMPVTLATMKVVATIVFGWGVRVWL